MIQNKIHYVSIEEAAKIAQETRNTPGLHLAEIQGETIQSWEDYIEKIEDVFKFPTKCGDYMDRYYDWITDLSWIWEPDFSNEGGCVLIIYNYKHFLEQDQVLKKKIMDGLSDEVLPWWQGDVENSVVNCVVGGKAKPFNIYLVD